MMNEKSKEERLYLEEAGPYTQKVKIIEHEAPRTNDVHDV